MQSRAGVLNNEIQCLSGQGCSNRSCIVGMPCGSNRVSLCLEVSIQLTLRKTGVNAATICKQTPCISRELTLNQVSPYHTFDLVHFLFDYYSRSM